MARLVRVELDDPRWLELASQCPSRSPFHHPSWPLLLSECYFYPGFGLALTDDDDTLIAGLALLDVSTRLRRNVWISLPFTDACQPLARSPDLLEPLSAALEQERQRIGVRRIEIRSELSAGLATVRDAGVIHKLGLTADLDELRRRFTHSQVRREIRRAEREGVSVVRAETVHDVASSFFDLHLRTRRHQGVPVQPRRFFRLLWERVLEPGFGFCLLARAAGEVVAGAVFLNWGSVTVYKYGASDRRALKLRPNHLLLWEAIASSALNGGTVFDFGRTERANEGLRWFKRSWGAAEIPLVYSTLGEPSSERAPAGLHILSAVIRRSPPIVCRALGEFLYRYAA
ncbi:MAG: GNAT family N-acetyltransferase [Actinomycetota bacterium]|nr:GNAT family N-acetyltransferase [Actinomycetota bacterium]